MNIYWSGFRQRHPRLFAGLIITKRLRTKVGLALAAYRATEGLYDNEAPFDLKQPKVWAVIGLVLRHSSIEG